MNLEQVCEHFKARVGGILGTWGAIAHATFANLVKIKLLETTAGSSVALIFVLEKNLSNG